MRYFPFFLLLFAVNVSFTPSDNSASKPQAEILEAKDNLELAQYRRFRGRGGVGRREIMV